MKVKIYRKNKDVSLPTRAHDTDAAVDVYLPKDEIFLPGEKKVIKLGIIAEAPVGFHFKMIIRSSTAFKRGFKQLNSIGIIDSSFSGPEDEMGLLLQAPDFTELTIAEAENMTIKLKKGERVCQLILERNHTIEWDEQENADFNKESRGGWGDSGK